jgi:hypothetical protein
MFLGLLDPDPDPLVRGTYESGSVSKSRSGSFYHQAKKVRKTLIPTALWLLFDFLSLKIMYMYFQDVKRKKLKRKK